MYFTKTDIANALINLKFSNEEIVRILDKLEQEKVAEAKRVIKEYCK